MTVSSRFLVPKRYVRTATLAITLLGLGAFGRTTNANLTITPTFDSSITSDPNAASIEGVIHNAINNYETRFTDPINVNIKFQEQTTGLGNNNFWYYNIPYQLFISSLNSDKSTSTDTTALAHLPSGVFNPVTNATTINVKTANLRALGITGLNSGLAGGVDGIISLNTHITDVGSPGSSGLYSLISTTEHEIDEVLGLGSAIASGFVNNAPLPEDLYRYDSSGNRSYVDTGDNAYFSLDGTTDLARFNQANNFGGDYGDWWSNNGVGNPGPNPPNQVQDAYIYPNRTPTLGVELTALDAIGYNLAAPEPGSLLLLIAGSTVACTRLRTRRNR